MHLAKYLSLSNRTVRILAGALIAGLAGLLVMSSYAEVDETVYVETVDRKALAQGSQDLVAELERLARTDHIGLLEMSLKHYDRNYRDFRATFVKQERIGGALRDEQEIRVKFRDRPFSVAMAWVRNAKGGDRVVYVEGRNDGKMVIRPAVGWQRALVGSQVTRDPVDESVMENTLRPVTMFGFRRGLENLLKVYRRAEKAGDLKTEFGGYSKVAGRECIKLVRALPPKPEYPCHVTEIHFDLETLLPICIKGINWDGELSSKYVYMDLKLNTGLVDADFLPENNDM